MPPNVGQSAGADELLEALVDTEDDLELEEELAEDEVSAAAIEFVPQHSDVEVDPQALEEESERLRRAAAETLCAATADGSFEAALQAMAAERGAEEADATMGGEAMGARDSPPVPQPAEPPRPRFNVWQEQDCWASRCGGYTAAQWAAWYNGMYARQSTGPSVRR